MKCEHTNIYWEETRLKAKLFNRKYWNMRNKFATILENLGYEMIEYDNCWRLRALKSNEEFIIDCQDSKTFHTHILPVIWVYGDTKEPILVTDIPDSGKRGVYNRNSKYLEMIQSVAKEVYK